MKKDPVYPLKNVRSQSWKGGITLPDIRQYNLASLFRRSIDWVINSDLYFNINLETSLVAPWFLMALLHTKYSVPREVRSSQLLEDTTMAWKAFRETLKLLYSLSKHMSLWGHPKFWQGLEGKQFLMWSHWGILKMDHLVHPQKKRYLCFQDSKPNIIYPLLNFCHIAILREYVTLPGWHLLTSLMYCLAHPQRSIPSCHFIWDHGKVYEGRSLPNPFLDGRRKSLTLTEWVK